MTMISSLPLLLIKLIIITPTDIDDVMWQVYQLKFNKCIGSEKNQLHQSDIYIK